MVLGGAFEFNKEYNNEIILREADDVELPRWGGGEEEEGREVEAKNDGCYGDWMNRFWPSFFGLDGPVTHYFVKTSIHIETGKCNVYKIRSWNGLLPIQTDEAPAPAGREQEGTPALSALLYQGSDLWFQFEFELPTRNTSVIAK